MSIYEVLSNWAGSNGPGSYPHDVTRVYTRPFHYQTRSSYHISALSVSSLSPLMTHPVFCFQYLPAKLLTIRCARIQPLNPIQGLAFNKWSQLTTHNSYVWELRDSYLVLIVMEANKMHPELEEDEEDFVLLNLDVLYRQFDIPPNVPYTLTDLDTLNPILIIDRKFKLVSRWLAKFWIKTLSYLSNLVKFFEITIVIRGLCLQKIVLYFIVKYKQI
ncbi:hypothetical protein Ddye_030014 [Dipteronia dyeriana]|uniref:Uncharacterized protein n=1 Tax=Dipteronia dyeriana TaxID=168575 RepID=A0AAD9WM31_9ROSI|nr:hypothetical protein Ddye_030014 [Dipteronia dyeriana]